MDLKLAGRTALITGGSKGIGLATAKWFAAEGVDVALVARSGDDLAKAADVVRAIAPVNVTTLTADLSQASARDKVAAQFPDVDVLVNNAGAVPSGALAAVDEAMWRAAWDLKVFGYIAMARTYFARMQARRRGVIVNIIGIGGERLDFNYIAGSTGNAALMAFTRALGGRSPDFGVRVVGVNPGPVATERFEWLGRQRAAAELGDPERWTEKFKHLPWGRPASSDEIAAAVVFLASDLSSYTSGTILTIDGGMVHRGGLL
ncbi:MAG TPA: SDR family oxidoreductase [Xanthobacteraceae bacterium]|nr:SDR family oxidoreductase [Xanthobacteraceae bacterium]